MTRVAWAELRLALAGSLRLARGDRGGLDCFDRSLDGFWRSFRAAVVVYPLYLLLLTKRPEWQTAGDWRIVAIETIGYVISWVAFPLVMLSVTRWLGRSHRFFDFMVPYNWCQVPQSVLFVLIGLESESGMFGAPAARAIELAGAIAVLVYEWFIARVALDVTRSAAVLVVLVDLALGALINRAALNLY
ncbi:MAG: hypothetical protein ACREFH_12935 [Stellaceae bacterium]